TLPAHTGTLQLPTATRIPAGGSFDGKMRRIDTGVPCAADVELFDLEIVFILGEGATLSNVIIGPAQKKGVHCLGKCTLINVWWSKTCHYGLSILSQKAGDKAIIKGGGAFGATVTNIIESSGAGTVEVSNFYAEGFNNLYKSIGYSAGSVARHAIITDVTAKNGKNLASINSNFGDTAKITKLVLKTVTNVCTTFKGT
ncbi:pectate lyase, partial [Leptodontidium sp. 2 PMI_412]